jgi:hypothetical protein
MFELGVRMAHDKPVVLMKAEGTGPLFDVDNMRVRVQPKSLGYYRGKGYAESPRLYKRSVGKQRLNENLHEDSARPREELIATLLRSLRRSESG